MVIRVHILFFVFAISLVGGVPVNDTDPLNYLNAVEVYKKAAAKLVSLLPDPVEDYIEVDVTNPKVHYALLISALDDISQDLVNNDSLVYDEYYLEGVRNRLFLHGLNDSNVVGRNVLNFLSKILDAVEGLVQLVEKTCHDPDVPNCDKVVTEAVKEDPKKYLLANNLLLQVAELSKQYLKNTYEKEAVAYAIVKTLVEGKEKLRKLVHELVLARKDLALFRNNETLAESHLVRSAPFSRYGVGPVDSPVFVAPVWRSDLESVGIPVVTHLWKSGVRSVETPGEAIPISRSDVGSVRSPVVTSVWKYGVGDVQFSGGSPVWRSAETPVSAPIWSPGVGDVQITRDWRFVENPLGAPVLNPKRGKDLEASVSSGDAGSVTVGKGSSEVTYVKEVNGKESDEEDDEVVRTIIEATLALLRPVVETVAKQLLRGNS